MKVYISGKISGIEEQAKNLFLFAETYLKSKGHEVVNPMTIEHNHDKTWINYMKTDIKAMMDCDTIYMLNNWKESEGAKIEWMIANELGMEIIYQR